MLCVQSTTRYNLILRAVEKNNGDDDTHHIERGDDADGDSDDIGVTMHKILIFVTIKRRVTMQMMIKMIER